MKRNLRKQVVLITLFSVFISAAAILLTASHTVSMELTRQQHRQTERTITYLAETIARNMPGSSVSNTEGGAVKLVAPPLSGFNDFNAVDQSVAIGGGAATVFSFDTKADNFLRHLTSIKTEKGERATGTMLSSDSPAQAFIRRGETYYGPTTLFGKHYYAIYQPTFDTGNHVNGILFAGSPMEELYDAGYHNIMWNLGLVSLALAAVLGLAVSSLVNRMFNPLRALARRVDGLTHGDLTSAIPALDRGDEIGSLAKAIGEFQASVRLTHDLRDSEEQTRRLAELERASRETLARAELESSNTAVNVLGAGLNQLAQGNLVHEIKTPLYPAAERLRLDLNQASRKLREAMTGVASAADEIGKGTIKIAETADDISRRTEQQAASLEETATALAEITNTVAGTASRVREAKKVVAAAKANAEDGGRVVAEAIEAMNQISSSAHQISSIISVIDEIAFQTNLLALNAGVEAARAGEAGRGFAVVASEVRALAQRSAEAAKEIKTLISTSAQQVDSGVGLVDKSGQVLTRILDEVAEINALVAQIAKSAQEQETSLQQVNIAVRDMNHVTHQNAAMVEQSTANIHTLAQQAEGLESLIRQFQIKPRMTDYRHSPRPGDVDAAA